MTLLWLYVDLVCSLRISLGKYLTSDHIIKFLALVYGDRPGIVLLRDYLQAVFRKLGG